MELLELRNVSKYFGNVTALEEPVRDARRAPRTPRDERRGVIGDRDLEDLGGPAEDALELRIGVVVEPIGHPEAIAQRTGDASHPRRGADDREVLDLEPDGPRARTLAEHDVEGEVLHRRIEDLLDRVAQAVDLVDEEDVPRRERREDGGEVAGTLDGRAGRRPDLGAHLRRHDVRQRGLAEAGRAVEEHVIDRLRPVARRVDEDPEVLLDPILTGELIETARTNGRLQRPLLLADFRARDALDRPRRSRPKSNM